MTRLLLILLLLPTAVACAHSSPPAAVVYLSSLTPTGTPVNGFGPYERDLSNGEAEARDGHPIKIGRVTYPKGLGVHAESDLTYALDKQYVSFSAVVGIDDELITSGCTPTLPGSVVFQVFVDGVKSYDSGVVTVWSAAETVSVDTTGKNSLRLVVHDAGDSNICDHADWADAKLTAQR